MDNITNDEISLYIIDRYLFSKQMDDIKGINILQIEYKFRIFLW